MEWSGGGESMAEEESGGVPANPAQKWTPVCPQPSAESMASLCQSQQRCVKASIESSWCLVEAQDQLCGLELHGSESAEQERARALAGSDELVQREREWRQKESMLGGSDLSRSPLLNADWSHDVFNKSIINTQSGSMEVENDKSKTFVQMYEEQLRHFGMLGRWDDSQRFLSERPHLICEETANYLILWCFRLQAEEKEALMEQIAHQAVVMQFILEMASNSKQDPRGVFRQFFQKAKTGQEGYLDVFRTELNAFKQRVKEYTLKSKGEAQKDMEPQTTASRCCLDRKEVLESLPPDLKAGFQQQDMQILQNVLSNMNPQVAEYHVKRCLEAGLWNSTTKWTKEEAPGTDESKRMETS
ncbi:hsp90 co-chaperone Cdc37-like 1 isoform X2 [Scleropages formosus]|uniref:Hsp90 co-chaperone Cdc37-like 1 n=1 Tax=Scleropages formosus TaxID=113540 RepID=A0A8C9W0Z7_SCLFO|nr:hsp90 co-chaperone Cdc37-like 1 isoform X2 [Scleropages formosus]